MLKKKISITFIILIFILNTIFIIPHDKIYHVNDVISPNEFVLNNNIHRLKGVETFDTTFSDKNKTLANTLNISENEAFVLGNLAKYWASDLMKGRKIYKLRDEDLIFIKYSYKRKFENSGYCLKSSKPYSKELLDNRINMVRKGNFKVLDLDTNILYSYKDPQIRNLKNFIVLRYSQSKKLDTIPAKSSTKKHKQILDKGEVKILVSDSTRNLQPSRNCSDNICREILSNINNAKKTIDMAIYGYSRVSEIEIAIKSALKRGVKIRLIYDIDSENKNIYPNTDILTKLIPSNINDGTSQDAKYIMHNKFYIFDNKTLITGSANISNTDMSGFNSNSIVIINSEKLAEIYTQEFEQMYNGKFHSEKIPTQKPEIKINNTIIKTYFSPQDKAITNAVLPLIKNARNYIYIPTFVLTEKRVTEELINAKNRGVEVKILIDALNASIKHSKHNELRLGGIEVKTENYAGKMHSKSMIIDDKYTIIGSMNFSNSGENRNDENLVVIEDSEIAKFYKSFFLYQWEKVDNKWLKHNARAEGKDSIGSCIDGLDNNYDKLIDSEDLACKNN